MIGKELDDGTSAVNTPAPIVRFCASACTAGSQRRLADIADARLAIEEASPSTEFGDTGGGNRVRPSTAWWRARPDRRSGEWRRPAFVLFASPSRTTSERSAAPDRGSGPDVVLCLDGFVARAVAEWHRARLHRAQAHRRGPRLFVRHLEHRRTRLLPETDGAASPFFSPDGQWLAFFASGKLKKSGGGGAITLCDAPNAAGRLDRDGTIFFSPDRQTGCRACLPRGYAGGHDYARHRRIYPAISTGFLGQGVALHQPEPAGRLDFDKGNSSCSRCQPECAGCCSGAPTSAVRAQRTSALLHNGTLFAEGLISAPRGTSSRSGDRQFRPTRRRSRVVRGVNAGTLAYTPEPAGTRTRPIEWIDRSGKAASCSPHLRLGNPRRA